MRRLLAPLLGALCVIGCGSGGNNGAAPSECGGPCPLEIEPRALTLGMPANGSVDPSQALWAVHRPPGAERPAYLRGAADWLSLDPSVVAVDADGIATPVARGEALIEAVHAGEAARLAVTVSGSLIAQGVDHDGDRRAYTLYVPDGFRDAAPRPLVVALHGGGGRSINQLRMAQLNGLAREKGFMVAYPEGTSRTLPLQTWNAGTCCGVAAERRVDDVGFLRAVVADAAALFAVDLRRVYITGMSNGGMMTHRVACEAADLFAAAAPVAGGLNVGGDFPQCTPSRAMPIIMFHGTTDRNYSLEGGDGVGERGVPETFYPVVHATEPDTLAAWRARNGATGSARRTFSGANARCDTHDGAAPVVMCIIAPTQPDADQAVVYDGGGHAWPGGVRALRAESDLPARDIDASAMMWSFFIRHALP